MAAHNPILEVRGLSIRFDGEPLFSDLSFALAPGERALLRGPSGSGKSSLLLSLLGFVIPEGGTITVEGQVMDDRTAHRLRRSFGWVSQEPDLGEGVGCDILRRPFRFKFNRGRTGALERVEELCERFLLPAARLSKDIRDLSGGEKQRIALISALLLDRPIYLLDEATSALDPQSRDAVHDYLNERRDLTILSISHDPASVPFADQVINLGEVENG